MAGDRTVKTASLILAAFLITSILALTPLYQSIAQARPDDETPTGYTRTPVSFYVEVNGSAYSIGYYADPRNATLLLNGSYTFSNPKNISAKVNITSGTLTINGQTYKVLNGSGVFNTKNGLIQINCKVEFNGKVYELILHGRMDQTTHQVTFFSPQSKLASQFFFNFDGQAKNKNYWKNGSTAAQSQNQDQGHGRDKDKRNDKEQEDEEENPRGHSGHKRG